MKHGDKVKIKSGYCAGEICEITGIAGDIADPVTGINTHVYPGWEYTVTRKDGRWGYDFNDFIAV